MRKLDRASARGFTITTWRKTVRPDGRQLPPASIGETNSGSDQTALPPEPRSPRRARPGGHPQQPEERTKGSGSRVACLAMVFKLSEAAAKKWRRLNGAELVRDVIDGVQFKDGKRAEDAA